MTQHSGVDRFQRQLHAYLQNRSGVGSSPSQLGVGLESISTDIRQKTDYAVELIDDYITQTVTNFYEYTRRFKDDQMAEFLKAMELLSHTLDNNALVFKDDIRWCEEEEDVTRIRRPVSDSYLNLFNSPHDDKEVIPEDFWKCLDFPQLKRDLVKAPDFQGISNIFFRKDCGKQINFLYQLCIALGSAVEDTSKMYEDVISAILKRVAFRESIGPTEKIEFDQTSSTVQGVLLTALIPNTIHRVWYRTGNLSPLSASGEDTKLLLSDPYQQCTGSDDIQDDRVDLLIRNVGAENTETDLRGIRREMVNVVDSIARASKRLTLLIDQIRSIPQTEVEGLNAYAIDDVTVLCGLYATTLKETLTFCTRTISALEEGFESGARLGQKIERLKNSVDQYIKVRKP